MITRPGITIDTLDRWIYRSHRLTNPRILIYFKSILRRDDRGYYLHNQFHDREEMAYLESMQGFPLIAVYGPVSTNAKGSEPGSSDRPGSLESLLEFHLDDESKVRVKKEQILLIDEDTPAFLHPQRNVPVRLNATATLSLSEHLDPGWEDGVLYWSGTQMERNPLQSISRESFFQIHGDTGARIPEARLPAPAQNITNMG